MARLTVSDLMVQIAATVNQEAVSPSAGSSEWSLWLAFLNRAVYEWAEANDWEDLRRRFVPTVTGTASASVALPGDFRKLAAYPRFHGSGAEEGGEEYPEIAFEGRGAHLSTDKYVYTVGDISNGYHLVFHPGTLASGASLEISYFSTPTSLASPAQVPLPYDSQFLIDRTIAYILEARSDPRFQLQETKARDRLLFMIENANLAKFNSFAGSNTVQTTEQKLKFRLGRD